MGGGAVFFDINKKKKQDSFLSDNNENLIQLYNDVQKDVGSLIDLLKIHKEEHSKNQKEYYYQMREKFNSAEAGIEKSALFLYLNKTCFNGLYRENSKGKFNVPFGRYKNPSILQESKLIEASNLLQGQKIFKANFKDIVSIAKEKDFIYFDPPYHPLSTTSSFTSYQKGSFSADDQKQLADVFKELDEMGCYVMLSNSDCEFTRNLFNEYEQKGQLYFVKARRMINSKANGRGAINEIVVRNY